MATQHGKNPGSKRDPPKSSQVQQTRNASRYRQTANAVQIGEPRGRAERHDALQRSPEKTHDLLIPGLVLYDHSLLRSFAEHWELQHGKSTRDVDYPRCGRDTSDSVQHSHTFEGRSSIPNIY